MSAALPSAALAGTLAVLFDLDGTLIDSAPDLAGAANDLRQQHGLPPLPYAELRPMVGSGARGMVGKAFGVTPADDAFEGLKDAFLSRYEARSLQETAPFPFVPPLLDRLEADVDALARDPGSLRATITGGAGLIVGVTPR